MKWKIIFEVLGRSEFPIDMLRYDSCWPMRQEDTANITHSLNVRQRQELTKNDRAIGVTLVSYSRTQLMAKPTQDRWMSFGWRVGESRVEKI